MLSRNKMSPNTIIISTVDKKSTTTIDSNSITTKTSSYRTLR